MGLLWKMWNIQEYNEEIKLVHDLFASREPICSMHLDFFSNPKKYAHFLDTSSSRQLISPIITSHYVISEMLLIFYFWSLLQPEAACYPAIFRIVDEMFR